MGDGHEHAYVLVFMCNVNVCQGMGMWVRLRISIYTCAHKLCVSDVSYICLPIYKYKYDIYIYICIQLHMHTCVYIFNKHHTYVGGMKV